MRRRVYRVYREMDINRDEKNSIRTKKKNKGFPMKSRNTIRVYERKKN